MIVFTPKFDGFVPRNREIKFLSLQMKRPDETELGFADRIRGSFSMHSSVRRGAYGTRAVTSVVTVVKLCASAGAEGAASGTAGPTRSLKR